jgi:predicted nucleotidyltransferase
MTAPPTAERLRSFVADAPADVVAVYLFGSLARGTASPKSDVDLGLLLRRPPASTLEGRMLDYEAELERTIGRPVQAVVLNDAPPDLAYRVLRDGLVLLERDRAARLRFEVRTRNLYFDLLPVLTRYRRRALERTASPP